MYRYLLTIALMIVPLCHAGESQITLNTTTIDVDLAITDNEHRQGLMGKTELKNNQGMLFIYSEPKHLSFWMKETLIPLDILFFDGDGRLLEIINSAPPCKKMPCKTYKNQIPAQYVLELRAGSAKQLKLKLGDRFQSSKSINGRTATDIK